MIYEPIINERASNAPGIYPARNRLPTDIPPADIAYITMLWLGGTKSPSHEDVIVTAVEKSSSYP